MIMNTKKLYNLSQQDFCIMDYDRAKLIVSVAVNGFSGVDKIELSQHDICECALAFRLIDSYYDPVMKGGDYVIDDYGHRMGFVDWWASVDPTDTDRIFSAAIATVVEEKAKAIIKELSTAVFIAA